MCNGLKFSLKCPVWSKSLLIFTLGFCSLWMAFRFSGVRAQEIEAAATGGDMLGTLLCNMPVSQFTPIELRSCANICSKDSPEEETRSVARRIKVILTAYSSTVWQTDSTPFITANGTYVHDGVVANNGFPFGTEIRIPELYGDKVFSVEDRMHWRKGNYHFDIWFPTYEQAKNFGVKYAYVEVLEK